MKLQYSLRSLFVCLTVVAVLSALVGALLEYVRHRRLTRDIVSESHWPPELRDLVSHLQDQGKEVGKIDVRWAASWDGTCWRMDATDDKLRAHINVTKYQYIQSPLVQVPNNGVEMQRFQKNFPPTWTWPNPRNVKCFAYPPGLPGAKEGEHEFILIHDTANQELFFYCYFNF